MKKFFGGVLVALICVFSVWLWAKTQPATVTVADPTPQVQSAQPNAMDTAADTAVDAARAVQAGIVKAVLQPILDASTGTTPIPQEWLEPAVEATLTPTPEWWSQPAVEASPTPNLGAAGAGIERLQGALREAQDEYMLCIADNFINQPACDGHKELVERLADQLRALGAAAAEAQR